MSDGVRETRCVRIEVYDPGGKKLHTIKGEDVIAYGTDPPVVHVKDDTAPERTRLYAGFPFIALEERPTIEGIGGKIIT